jgi:hypothetical protein
MPSKPDFKPLSTYLRRSRVNLVHAFALGSGIVAMLATVSWAAATKTAVSKTPIATPTRTFRVTAGSRSATMTTKNPHLHVNMQTRKTSSHHKGKSHHSWHSRWSYYAWAGSHRGLGMVQGEVHDKHGRPMAFAMVELKHNNGVSFQHASMRHKVHANAAGQFVMMGVRSGKYRISSYRGHSHGHSHVTVHTNTMAAARIKI